MKTWIKFGFILTGICLAVIVSACDPIPNCVPVYDVTKTDDTDDGVCSAGDCSLREAVDNANACAGSQTINLPAGGYVLTIDGDNEDLNETGDLDVTDDLIINGTGAPSIHGGIERAFHIHNGVTAEFNAIWIADGDTILGGGLINEGDLTLNAFTCNYNSVSIPPEAMGDARGGCIFNTANLVIQGGQFLSNTAGYGGAIFNLDNATATLENINFIGNEADYNGGALWMGVDTDVNVSSSTFENNIAGLDGGAIWNHGSFISEDISLMNNESGGSGGAVYVWTDTYTQFTNCNMSGNTAVNGGAIYNNNGMMHLYQCGLSTNTATGPVGGGIYNNGPVPSAGLFLQNVTVSNNTAMGGVGGGGIYNTGNFDFRFITIAENDPGGLRIDTGSEIKLRSSILAYNTGGNCNGISPDSLGYNLDSDGSCGLSELSDLSSIDPLLDPLGPHGGMGLSHPLGTGSPAIDSGTPDMCISTDQNGITRPQGPWCDRGAFEDPVIMSMGPSISGLVWHDLCAVPYATPPTPPPGCIELGGGGLGANGILEPGEPGIPGVRVQLYDSSCPPVEAALFGSVLTDSNGEYTISDIGGGTWCVAVNALEPPNDTILIPGGWTFPDYGDSPATYEIILGPSENVTDINFGWDYQFLPAPDEDSDSESSFKGKLIKNAYCRTGPGNYYLTDTAFPIGTEFDILGRSELDLPLWLFIEEWYLKFRCWIWNETAEFEIDPELIPTVISPPTPIPCSSDLNEDDCRKAGGRWTMPVTGGPYYCECD
jgi:CSLREA domain-containing protein